MQKRSKLLVIALFVAILFLQGCIIPVPVDCVYEGTFHVLVYDKTLKQNVNDVCISLIESNNKIGCTDKNGYFEGDFEVRYPDIVGIFFHSRDLFLFLEKDQYCDLHVKLPKAHRDHICLKITLQSRTIKEGEPSETSVADVELVPLKRFKKILESKTP